MYLAHRYLGTVLLVTSLLFGAAVIGLAQKAGPPTFDVSSVRSSAPGATVSSQHITDTRIDLVGQSLRSVLLLAFRVRDYQLSAPSWLGDVRVDIQATLPADATRRQVPEMLQDLLSKRFYLVVRRELRSVEAYELTVESGGVKMEQVEPLNELDRAFPVSAATPSAFADRRADTPDGPVRTILGDDLSRTTVTNLSRYQVKLSDTRTQIVTATRMTMGDLAVLLERVTGQPILDKTNLTSLYAFTVELPPDNRAREIVLSRPEIDISRMPTLAVPPVTLTSEAIKKLGLRLERRRSQIETIVVERIERTPVEN